RHCCPPSLSGWRHRCSAVANRHALSSDYYSRKKITVTPLNFVCKCRTPLPPHKRLAVFRKNRIEQIFSRACKGDLFFAHCRNADELRVFVMRRCLLFSLARAARSFACARFRSRESARSNGFTKAKFFCGEPPKQPSGGRFGTQNAQIGP